MVITKETNLHHQCVLPAISLNPLNQESSSSFYFQNIINFIINNCIILLHYFPFGVTGTLPLLECIPAAYGPYVGIWGLGTLIEGTWVVL